VGRALTRVSDLTPHPHGITAVDTHYLRPRLDAAHLIVHRGRAAFVDTGTSLAVPRLLQALAQLGVAPDAVDYVFLTHVHLDHAGGAGQLMQALPRARAVLHPRGAPHLVDPARLIAASIQVYGAEKYARLYGEIVPIPAERVHVTHDGERLELAGRPFEFLHTPGHALHHQAIADLDANAIFSGDTFGMAYPEFELEGRAFIVPTTTPTQFDPDQLVASIRRLAARQPESVYLTHYSRVTEVARLAASLEMQVREFERFALANAAAADPVASIRAAMRALWLRLAHEHGGADAASRVDALLGGDVALNTDGLVAWLGRRPH
jgi:glyoxylase-like metal-dependent hydrolase (beta-lactamase superfamily II)